MKQVSLHLDASFAQPSAVFMDLCVSCLVEEMSNYGKLHLRLSHTHRFIFGEKKCHI